MHAELTTLFILGDGLYHRAEDVRIDLRPVQPADVDQELPRDLAEARHIKTPREKSAIYIREDRGPWSEVVVISLISFRIHRPKNLDDDLVGIRGVLSAHLCDRVREESVLMEDVGIFREEAKDQPREEVVQIFPALVGRPIRVVLEQFDIKLVQTAGGADVERVLSDLPNRRDACERQEEAEVVGQVGVVADQRFPAAQILSVDGDAICRQDVLGFLRLLKRKV